MKQLMRTTTTLPILMAFARISIVNHHKGYEKGVASNHGDAEYIWNNLGLSMSQFRRDVKKAMVGDTVTTVPSTPVDNSSDDTTAGIGDSKQALTYNAPKKGSIINVGVRQ